MIYHLFSDFRVARQVRWSWDHLIVPVGVEFRRESYLGGRHDREGKPQINEMIDSVPGSGEDVVMLTNSDSFLCSDTVAVVSRALESRVGCYSHRVNVSRFPRRAVQSQEIATRPPYLGVDLVAFKLAWWRSLALPPFWLGCEAWDWVLRAEILDAGGVEVGPLVIHENHGATWTRRRLQGVNAENRRSAREWAEKRGWKWTLERYPAFGHYLIGGTDGPIGRS